MSQGGNLYPVVLQLAADTQSLVAGINQANIAITNFSAQTIAEMRRMTQQLTQVMNQTAQSIQQTMQQTANQLQQTIQQTTNNTTNQAQQAANRIQRLQDQMARSQARSIVATQQQIQQGINDRILRTQALENFEHQVRVRTIRQYVQNTQQANQLIQESHRTMQMRITAVTEEEARKREARLAREANNRREDLRRGFLSVGATGMIGGMGIFREIGQQIDVTREFDKNMHNVDSIAKLTAEGLRQLSQDVLDYTKVVPQSAAQISDALGLIYSSGFDKQVEGQATALEVMKIAAHGAAAGLAETTDVVRALTGTANAYNMKTGPEMRFILDALFKTVEQGVITFPELAQSFGGVVSSAEAAGLSINDAGAAIAVLTQKGLPASEAMTSLNSLLTHLTTPAEEAGKAAASFGLEWLNASQAAKHIQDVGLAKALDEIAEATGGNISKMKQILPEIRGLRGILKLAGEDADSFTTAFRKMQEEFKPGKIIGAEAAAFQRQMEAYDAKIKKLNNALDRIRITLGSSILGMILPLAEGAARLADAFDRLPPSIKAAVAALELFLGTALITAGIIGTLGVAIVGWQTLMGTAFGASLRTLIGGWATTAANAFRLVAGPIAILIAAVTLLWATWKSNFGHIRDSVQEVSNYAAVRFKWLSGQLSGAWAQMSKEAAELWRRLTQGARVGLGILDKIFETFVRFVTSLMKAFIDGITGNWKDMWINLGNATKIALGWIGDWFSSAMSGIAKIVGDASEGLARMWQGLMEQPTDWEKGKAKVSQGWSMVLSSLGNNIGDGLSAIESRLTAFNARGAEILSEFGKGGDIFRGIPDPGYKIGDLPDRSLTPEQYQKRFGGKPQLKSGEFSREVQDRLNEAKVQKMSFEQTIAHLQKLRTEYKLTKDQEEDLGARIIDMRKKHQKELDALAKKGAAEAKRAAAHRRQLEAEEASLGFNRLKGEYSKFFNYIKQEAAKAAGYNKDIQATALEGTIQLTQSHIKQLEAQKKKLESSKGGKDSQRQARINAIQQEIDIEKKYVIDQQNKLKAIREGQAEARAMLAQEVTDIEDRLDQDGFVRKMQRQEAQFRSTVDKARNAGVLKHELQQHEAKQEQDLTAAKLKYITELGLEADKAQETSFEARMAKQNAEWDKLIVKAQTFAAYAKDKGDTHMEGIANGVVAQLQGAKTTDGTRLTNENSLQVLQGWEQTFNKMNNLWSVFAEEGSTAMEKIVSGMGIVFQGFKEQIATVVVPALSGLFTALNSFIAANPILLIFGLFAAAIVAFNMFDAEWKRKERERLRIMDETARIKRGLTEDRLTHINIELEAELARLDTEMEEARKKGENVKEIEARINAERLAAYYKFNQDILEHSREVEEAKFDYWEQIAELSQNKEVQAEVAMNRELADLNNELLDKYKKGLISFDQFEDSKRNARLLAERKYYDELVDIRMEAHEKLQGMSAQLYDLENNALEHAYKVLKLTGQLTDGQFNLGMAWVNSKRSENEVELGQGDIDQIEKELAKGGLSDEKRAELEAKLMETIVKIQKSGYDQIEGELEAYAESVNDTYKDIEDGLKDQKDALEDKIETEKKAHQDTLDGLKAEEKALKRTLDLRDAEIDKIKEKYDLLRENYELTDQDEFRAAVASAILGPDTGMEVIGDDGKASRVSMGPDNNTYEGLENQMQQAKNLYVLGARTQKDREEYVRTMQTLAAMQGRLADDELRDTEITYDERRKATDKLREAFEIYNEAKLEFWEEEEKAEIKAQDAAAKAAETRLNEVESLKIAAEESLAAVDELYKADLEALNLSIKTNKKDWDKALKGIKDGTAGEVKLIANSFKPLEDKINLLITRAGKLVAAIRDAKTEAVTLPQTINMNPEAMYPQGSISYGTKTPVDMAKNIPPGYNPNQHIPPNLSVNPGFLFAATGGWTRGGQKGIDSIPVMMQDGEYALDTSQAAMLTDMLRAFRDGLAFGPRMVQYNYFYFQGITIREEKDIRDLARAVGVELARG